MDAFGKTRILIETVGVGQSELEVAHSADTTIVVLVPQSGDSIQAMKAGLMEIADIFVMNKCDRDGSDRAYRELVSVLHMRESSDGWHPPVIKTVAESGEGIDELVEMIDRHHEDMLKRGQLEERRRDRTAAKVRRLVENELQQRIWQGERERRRLFGLQDATSPYHLAESLLQDFYREMNHE